MCAHARASARYTRTVQTPTKPPLDALVFWLGSAVVWWAGLAFVVPVFEKMFREVSVTMWWGRRAVIAVSHFTQHPMGMVLALALLCGSIAAYTRWKAHARTGVALEVAALMGWLTAAGATVALFSPIYESSRL